MLIWLGGSALLLLLGAVLLLLHPQVPFVFGLIHTQGTPAVFATLLPALCGLAALLGLILRKAFGPLLLLLYSLFWLVTLAGASLVAAIRSGIPPMENTAPGTGIVGGTAFAVIMAVFLLTALWSIRRLGGWVSRRPIS